MFGIGNSTLDGPVRVQKLPLGNLASVSDRCEPTLVDGKTKRLK
jgi:hypothetical protein